MPATTTDQIPTIKKIIAVLGIAILIASIVLAITTFGAIASTAFLAILVLTIVVLVMDIATDTGPPLPITQAKRLTSILGMGLLFALLAITIIQAGAAVISLEMLATSLGGTVMVGVVSGALLIFSDMRK